uniref:Large ribosomal subunit protein bL20c n=1 Tax=Dictyopteris divaricata TaxID=156996 RepID=A0A2I4Q2E5_9PHAE|nr:50S ribosomal protein L20 [Dictyopteris divaricata]YP_010205293.1 50S ribosomal protein L20 [Grateloupia livida]AQZ25004.1 50S ribosomal protein L20 [Dictyopteris divaricata]UAV85862.1 50S ribosomal protein L20 [Grateloupia livida]
MVRVKRGNIARKRRNKILKRAKGFFGAHSNSFRIANQQVLKSLRYEYVGRKTKKRVFRQLWIIRINAAVKKYDLCYSQFIFKLKQASILLNRKMLSQLAILDPKAFSSLIAIVK